MSTEVVTTMTVRKTFAVAQLIPQYRHNEGQGRRKLLTPDEVLRLPHEELLCVIRGCNILKLNKFDYLNHPMAKLLKKTSIYEYVPEETSTFHIPESIGEIAHQEKFPNRNLYSSAKPPDEF